MKVNISRIQTKIKKIALADRGQSMTEYALICALLAFGATAGYRGMAEEVGVAFTHVSSMFTDAFGSAGGANGSNSGGGSNAGNNGNNGKGGNGGNGGNGGGGKGGHGGH
jgi:Flp pilus assembly pilin Flp